MHCAIYDNLIFHTNLNICSYEILVWIVWKYKWSLYRSSPTWEISCLYIYYLNVLPSGNKVTYYYSSFDDSLSTSKERITVCFMTNKLYSLTSKDFITREWWQPLQARNVLLFVLWRPLTKVKQRIILIGIYIFIKSCLLHNCNSFTLP